MKICDRHRDQIRAALWATGIKPSLDGAEASGRGSQGGDHYTMVQALLLANAAKNFPGSAVHAPAESCPLCGNAVMESWIPEAVASVKIEIGY